MMVTTVHEILDKGIVKLELIVNQQQREKLIAYIELLLKWNKVYSLTAIKKPTEIIVLHILDGLSVVPYFNQATNVLDVGSGMGVPAVILAIMLPDVKVTAIDSNGKKATFLRQVAIELDLVNLIVINSRVESLASDNCFSLITSRAFADLAGFINLSGHLLAENGKFLAMKSEHGLIEAENLPDWHTHVIALKVPFLEAQRFLIEMMRK